LAKKGEFMVLGREFAYPKVNIFLKIVGFDGEYHLLESRFMEVRGEMFDVIEIREGEKFNIFADEVNCVLRENSVFLAYWHLITQYPQFREWFIGKEIHLKKGIPEMAGLGGGSSDAGAFLRLVNRLGDFGLTTQQLMEIGAKVGSDVPFFVANYPVANVKGRGEIVEPFGEEPLELEIFVPPIESSTGEVYKEYRARFFNPAPSNFLHLSSRELLENYSPAQLNDLLLPALSRYPELQKYSNFGFMSGSGSAFFRLKKKERGKGE
jgi:4-diphosphocytidyl-2-C-methyl-D-erythritol kinase